MPADSEVLGAGRGGHAVVFYPDDEELAKLVSGFLLPSVRGDGAAIVLATTGHQRSFEARLTTLGADLTAARESGSYLTLDACETLNAFMVSGWPDPGAFWRAVSPLVRSAAQAGRPVRIFGEMVALLWQAGLLNAAIELEAMWNELAGQYPFSLLCAYPTSSAWAGEHSDALSEVCRVHSDIIGGPWRRSQTQPEGL